MSDWYTKGGFTLPNGTRYSSGHRFKIAFWEIWNEVNLFREHNMSAQTYVEYYDQQVAAMRRSAGGLVRSRGDHGMRTRSVAIVGIYEAEQPLCCSAVSRRNCRRRKALKDQIAQLLSKRECLPGFWLSDNAKPA